MKFFEKVSFNKWYRDIPLIGLQAWIARMWHHDIPDPIVDIGNGTVVFYAPYQITIGPGNMCRIPTGYMPAGAKEEWGEVTLRVRNKSITPLEIRRGEPLIDYSIQYKSIFHRAASSWLEEMEQRTLREC